MGKRVRYSVFNGVLCSTACYFFVCATTFADADSTPQPSAAATPTTATNPKNAWGTVRAEKATGCATLLGLDLSVEGAAASIGVAGGHVHALSIQSASDDRYRQVSKVCMVLPLTNPLILRRPLMVAVAYHAEPRQGWVKGRLRLSVNQGPELFAWLGGGVGPDELRVSVPTEAVVSAGGLVVTVSLEGRSLGGSQVLVLDRVNVTED